MVVKSRVNGKANFISDRIDNESLSYLPRGYHSIMKEKANHKQNTKYKLQEKKGTKRKNHNINTLIQKDKYIQKRTANPKKSQSSSSSSSKFKRDRRERSAVGGDGRIDQRSSPWIGRMLSADILPETHPEVEDVVID